MIWLSRENMREDESEWDYICRIINESNIYYVKE